MNSKKYKYLTLVFMFSLVAGTPDCFNFSTQNYPTDIQVSLQINGDDSNTLH